MQNSEVPIEKQANKKKKREIKKIFTKDLQ